MSKVEQFLNDALRSDDPQTACAARCTKLLDAAYLRFHADEVALGTEPEVSINALTTAVAYILSCHIACCTSNPISAVVVSKHVADKVEKRLQKTSALTAVHKLGVDLGGQEGPKP